MIEVKNISKSYGAISALKSLSFSIKKGEFYSLLGPNGAGKTTTINILGALFPPDSGSISIHGMDLDQNTKAVKNRIGIVPQEIALYEDLNAFENLKFWARINKIEKKGLDKKITEVLDFLGLIDRAKQRISKYSGGMKRRINIAAALLHEPEILFFDEPTVGIDPQSRSFIYSIFKSLQEQGKTILYTSHYLEEVEKLSDRIGIIDHGELIAEGSFEDLRHQSGLRESIIINYKALSVQQFNELKSTPLIANSLAQGGRLSEEELIFIGRNRTADLSAVLTLFNQLKIEAEDIEIKTVDLDAVYMHFTKSDLRD
jgi:ABC-2 type transport system ATP-binding protein